VKKKKFVWFKKNDYIIKIISIFNYKNNDDYYFYIWGIRHPESGYVQGINDLCAPFLLFLYHKKFPNYSQKLYVVKNN